MSEPRFQVGAPKAALRAALRAAPMAGRPFLRPLAASFAASMGRPILSTGVWKILCRRAGLGAPGAACHCLLSGGVPRPRGRAPSRPSAASLRAPPGRVPRGHSPGPEAMAGPPGWLPLLLPSSLVRWSAGAPCFQSHFPSASLTGAPADSGLCPSEGPWPRAEPSRPTESARGSWPGRGGQSRFRQTPQTVGREESGPAESPGARCMLGMLRGCNSQPEEDRPVAAAGRVHHHPGVA